MLMICISAFSQITIDHTDMPAPGDTLRLSISTAIQGDFTKTGYDTIWDFSSLLVMNQRVDTFVSVTDPAIPYLYLIFFPPTVSNLASPMGGAGVVPGVPVSSGYRFYNNVNASFTDLGFAVELQGLPLALKYDNPDIQYKFPLTTGTPNWSSNSMVSISIPGTGSFYTSRTRQTQVDGWGTLITPFGTFSTIRVKSHLIEIDSITLDTGSMNFPVTRDIMEYKWLAKGLGEPVLQINQEGLVATAIYRDSVRQNFFPLSVNLGPDTTVTKGTVITITAHPSGGTPPYKYLWNTYDTTQTITKTINATQTFVVFAIDAGNNFSMGTKNVTVLNPGIEEKTAERIDIWPNPTAGEISFRLPAIHHEVAAELFNEQGQSAVKYMLKPSSSGEFKMNFPGLISGFYILKVRDGRQVYYSGLSLQKK